MTISYSIASTVNYETVGLGAEDPDEVFPAIYGNLEFGYTVTFSSSLGQITSTNITSSPSYTDETVLSQNSVRIEKNSSVVFPGEDYDFAIFDQEFNKSVETYIPGETDLAGPESSIFAWNTPSQEIVQGNYVFQIDYIDSSTSLEETVNKTFSQTLRWSQFPGAIVLQQLVSRSKY